MIGCLWTCVRKQPIIALYFESENVLKFYNFETRRQNLPPGWNPLPRLRLWFVIGHTVWLNEILQQYWHIKNAWCTTAPPTTLSLTYPRESTFRQIIFNQTTKITWHSGVCVKLLHALYGLCNFPDRVRWINANKPPSGLTTFFERVDVRLIAASTETLTTI